MPIVAHSDLPTFAELRSRGEDVLTLDQALGQDIRELHVGLLNMMPDAALHVTERQFIRLVGRANRIVQVYVHPFSVPGLPRGEASRRHVADHYQTFEQLQRDGLDALVVTGANPATAELADEPFYEPLAEVVAWASEHVTSTLCSCLATHALLQSTYGIRRRPLQSKRWGVLPHRALDPQHPLLRGTNTRFDVPHSRWNEVTAAQLRAAGLPVLVESLEGDVHLATSPDGLRLIYLQGHPEYDTNSLLKEHKRELTRYAHGELTSLPPLPERYLPPEAARLLNGHVEQVAAATEAGRPAPAYPEAELEPWLDNTWADTAAAVFDNWLGLVYRLTDVERGVPFAPDVDPSDPLAALR